MNTSTVVGIIGSNGKYGKWLTRFFEQQGCKVIGSDVMTDLTNRQVVEKSDVVIFSVPINMVVQIIGAVAKFSHEGQLFMDVTSIKTPAVEAMLKSLANVVGLHPMCAPIGETLRGQVIVRCDARLTDAWKPWVEETMGKTCATIKNSTPEEHDHYMAFIQALPHAIHLIMARVICSFDVDVLESMSYTSPFYKIAFGLMGRILSKDSSMYASIQMDNPKVPEVIEAIEHEVKRFGSIVGMKNRVFRAQAFNGDFEASRKHFGKESIAKADRFFDDIIGLMSDFSKENMFVLESEADQPGIMNQITGIFADAGINLTSVHSQKRREGGFRFLVGFDKHKDSPDVIAVRYAIEKMPIVKIVS